MTSAYLDNPLRSEAEVGRTTEIIVDSARLEIWADTHGIHIQGYTSGAEQEQFLVLTVQAAQELGWALAEAVNAVRGK